MNAANPVGPDSDVWAVVDRDGALYSEAESEELDRIALEQSWASAKANRAEAAWREVFRVAPPEPATLSTSATDVIPLTSPVDLHGAQ